MGATLRYIGVAVFAGLAWLLLAEAVGWIPEGSFDRWIRPLAGIGAAAFGAGLLLGVLFPVARRIRRGKCVRCGTRIERGQVYCMDHLQATVNEYREDSEYHGG